MYFYQEPKKIKVFAYFFEPNEKVMVEFANFGKVENVEEQVPVETEQEKPKEPTALNNENFKITADFLDEFMSKTKHGTIKKTSPYNKRIPAYIDYLNFYMEKFGIKNSKQRMMAHFLGQVAKETKFWSYNEDFIFAKGKLSENFRNFKTQESIPYAQKWEYKNNSREITKEIEIQIANYAYARPTKAADFNNKVCLKDPKQDGYNYRGRGLIQITGRSNYEEFQKWYDLHSQELQFEKINFIKNPDKVLNPINVVLSSIYFWDKKNLNTLADKGIEPKHILAISNIINSGEADEKKKIRKDYVLAAYEVLKGAKVEIEKNSSDNPTNTKENGKWHDPVDNPQITLHNFGGNYDPDFSSFGGHRGRPHTGLDIFAINKKTKIYACLKGNIVFSDNIPGYGKSIVIEVDKNELEKYNKNYSLNYDREVMKGNLYDSGNNRYILYAHLNSFEFKKNEVEAGDIIAISGVTGVAEGTHGPHLHIEFSSKKLPQRGDGYKYRCNPLCYITLSSANLQLQNLHNKTNRSTDRI